MAKLGINSKLYINEGTYGAPDFPAGLVDLISDAQVGAKWNEGEATVRRQRVQQFEPTTLALEYTGNVRVDPGDNAYESIRDAFVLNTVLDVLILNGAITNDGSDGFRFDAKVFDLSEDQALGNVLFKSFTIKPCASGNVPKHVIITGGVPVYTDIGEPEPS